MVIAALICFVALLIAWIVAPDEGPTSERSAPAFEPEMAPAA
ncbi:MAG TPA: hypothetical protein VGA26_00115 [Candidatus Limnocylindria bacterium]|jgi:hypothetical protein